MTTQHKRILSELETQLELDDRRQPSPLVIRVRAVAQARRAHEPAGERQALIELAAACIAAAEILPAPPAP